jgi:hypothetical protein
LWIIESLGIDDHYRTFQAGFIIAILLGLGVGEMLFGRFSGTLPGNEIH